MTPTNLLFIMSDEHNRRSWAARASDDPHAEPRPARGTRHALHRCLLQLADLRAGPRQFATGRYVHQIRFWDNAIPYDGAVPSWGHRLTEHGHRVTSIGKLHYRSTDDATASTKRSCRCTWSMASATCWAPSATIRRRARRHCGSPAGRARQFKYQGYDDRIAEAATHWLRHRAADAATGPGPCSSRSSARISR